MDHWGDPWADDAETKTPPKELEVKKPIIAPAVLQGFEDEAQWGSPADGDGFGDWTGFSAPIGYQESHAEEEERLEELKTTSTPPSLATASEQHETDTPPSGSQSPITQFENGHKEGTLDVRDDTWRIDPTLESNSTGHGPWDDSQNGENFGRDTVSVEAEASDSGTTVHPDIADDEQTEVEPGPSDDDASTRPSTSPSDASQPELPHESPRTSFEEEGTLVEGLEERTAKIEEEALATPKIREENGIDVTQHLDSVAETEDEDDFGEFEGDDDDEDEGDDAEMGEEGRESEEIRPVVSPAVSNFPTSDEPTNERKESLEVPRHSLEALTGPGSRDSITVASFQPDLSLIDQLFPSPPPFTATGDTPDDTISSTSTRKAWYRLTREQTLREFNSGTDNDSYVRVSWIGSTIRTKVNKIVGRWSAEDRIAGRAVLGGKSAGAMFFWDQPTQATESTIGTPSRHALRRSSLSSKTNTTSPTLSTKSTDTPLSPKSPTAHFNWSSSPNIQQSPSISVSGEAAKAPRPSVEEMARNAVGQLKSGRRNRLSISTDASMPGNLIMPIAKVQASSSRPLSMDITRGIPSHPVHKRASQSTTIPAQYVNTFVPAQTPTVDRLERPPPFLIPENKSPKEDINSAMSIPPSAGKHSKPSGAAKATLMMDMDPWAGLTRLDTSSKAPPTPQNPPQDEDDDWGEMVQSPMTPAPTPILRQSQIKPAPPQQDPSRRYAPSVVRLMTPISPTAASGPALANPYGSIAKPFGMSRTPSPNIPNATARTTPPPLPSSSAPTLETRSFPGNADFSVLESSLPQKIEIPSSVPAKKHVRIASPPVVASTQPDSLATVDFSIFDSPAAPPASQSSSASPLKHMGLSKTPVLAPVTSDPLAAADFSIFETPSSFVASPSQAVSMAPAPNLSRASSITSHPPLSSTKRKEAEEAEILRQIIQGFPDLSYMLR
ncbi:hypothetical protein BU16DRAFT_584340 [Lophium mytilinum]|uniref:Uncharacterized protein n=1 Tax=Lophium mytilinum TaxID=390894 RepID=A0A6A6QKK4_9PEZI|nr:hypothetical protein BU16DRAFT_584340 [Lophium mytilinum]